MRLDRFRGDLKIAFAIGERGYVREWERGRYPFPVDWHIYPSNVCNHKCTWCMFRQPAGGVGTPEQDIRVQLPDELLFRAVNDAADTGAKLVHFSGGGEPLLHKKTLEAMRTATGFGLTVALSTNGRLLTPEIAAQCDHLRISLNAGTAKQHHKTNHGGDPTDKGDWEIILENIARSSPEARGDVGLGFVVDHENLYDIPEFVKVAVEVLTPVKGRQRFVHIRPAFYHDKSKDQQVRAFMPYALKLCHQAREKYGGRGVDIYALTSSFDGYWTPRTYASCKAVLTGICLRATGDFAVCQDRTDLTFGAGYRLGQPFREIWGSPEHLAVVDRITIHEELSRCPRCVWNGRNEILNDLMYRDTVRWSLI